MGQSWQGYEAAAERGPLALALKLVVMVFILTAVIGTGAYVFGWFGETARVAKEEFGPEASLAKYEWFKDAAAQLEKKQADVQVYQGRLTQMETDYADTPRADWAREDRQQYNVWASEVAGVKASYNQLAAEYNANMVKINWQFAEIGDLPPGADQPLPREFKPYLDE